MGNTDLGNAQSNINVWDGREGTGAKRRGVGRGQEGSRGWTVQKGEATPEGAGWEAPRRGPLAPGFPAVVLRGTLATGSQLAAGSVGGRWAEGGEAETSRQLQVTERWTGHQRIGLGLKRP